MITTEIRPRGSCHRDDGHEEEILQANSDTKKKVTNNDGYINLKHHQRDADQTEEVPDHALG